jgi:uncharacterized membrane protein YGL010W
MAHLVSILSILIYWILRIVFGLMIFGLVLFIIYIAYMSYKMHKNGNL